MKNETHRRITFLSVGVMKSQPQTIDIKTSQKTVNQESIDTDNNMEKTELKDKLISLGEYSDTENCFYITFIKPSNPNIQYSVKSTEKFYEVNKNRKRCRTNAMPRYYANNSGRKERPCVSGLFFISF